MSKPADNFKDAYNLIDLDSHAEKFHEKYYVERKLNQSSDLFNLITITQNPAKILFGGHRGSGKTTELHHLQNLLNKTDFIVLFVAARDDGLDRADLYYTDILLAILKKTVDLLSDRKLKLKKSTLDKLTSLLEELSGERKIKKEKIKKRNISFGGFFYKIGGFLESDVSTKEEFRKNATSLVQEIIDTFNELIEEIEKTLNKKVVVIVDDLEKVTDEEKLSDFILGYSRTVMELNCNLILTIPHSLFYSPKLMQVTRTYDFTYSLPLFEVVTKEGKENKDQICFLEEIIKKKVSLELISLEMINKAALFSGGLITDFLRMLKNSCLKSISQHKETLEQSVLEESFLELIEDYRSSVQSEHIVMLKEINKTKHANINDDFRMFLYNLTVLEYKNLSIKWYDLHPAVKQII